MNVHPIVKFILVCKGLKTMCLYFGTSLKALLFIFRPDNKINNSRAEITDPSCLSLT